MPESNLHPAFVVFQWRVGHKSELEIISHVIFIDRSSRQRIVTVTQQTSGSGWVQIPQMQQQQQQQQTVVYQTVQPRVQPSPTPAAVGGGASSAVSSSSSSFDAAVLAEHNRLRAKHSAQPLTLSSTLNQCAQEWANVSNQSQTVLRFGEV